LELPSLLDDYLLIILIILIAGSANPGTLGATKPAQRLLVTALSAQDSAPPPTSSKG
jgi:hypothetical protein